MLNLVVLKVVARLPKVKNEWTYRYIRPYALSECSCTFTD